MDFRMDFKSSLQTFNQLFAKQLSVLFLESPWVARKVEDEREECGKKGEKEKAGG